MKSRWRGYVSPLPRETIEMAENNTDVKNNFWRIEDYGTKSSRFDPGGNSGWMNTYDDLRDSTTPLHENAHGLGLDHTAGDIKSTVPPGIMVARASTVSNKFSIDGKSVNGVDPYTRKFSQNEINSILSKVKFDASGRGEIGKTSNSIYNRQGNHRTFGDKVKTFFNNLF